MNLSLFGWKASKFCNFGNKFIKFLNFQFSRFPFLKSLLSTTPGSPITLTDKLRESKRDKLLKLLKRLENNNYFSGKSKAQPARTTYNFKYLLFFSKLCSKLI